MNGELTEQVFAETIAVNGGRVYRVGGCVRDMVMGVMPKDVDLCVVGMVKKNFKTLFPDAEEYGKSFPVFRLRLDGIKCEVAFARTERKVGSGYKGFKVSSKPKVTIEEDLYRRDLTVNSIAIDSLTGKIIDPFNGIQDINDKILRATSPHFSDDPIRALRLAGQSARLGFGIDSDTLIRAGAVGEELVKEPVERIVAELAKVLTEARDPAQFFKVMAQTNLLQITFEEISELSKEVFEIGMAKLNLVAKATQEPKLRFAALGLVLDKERLHRWNKRMTLPSDWLDSAVEVGKIKALLEAIDAEKIVAAINSLRRGSLNVEEFDVITTAAGLNIPALTPFKAAMALLPGDGVPERLTGKALGEWLKLKHIDLVSKLI